VSAARIEALGERAWLLRLGDAIDASCNRRVHALARHIREQAPGWLEDVVPAYASLAVVLRTDALEERDTAREWLAACGDCPAPEDDAEPGDVIEIPVLYGGEAGPDLESCAEALSLPVDELIRRHSGTPYQVAMLGFAPGFPYLLGLDPTLALPRLDRPRLEVPAGSVGIGGDQTGIYPQAGAGGWRLFGRTPLRLFDLARERPALLKAGDRVRFVPIDGERYEALARAPGGLDAR
jgi:KipI family sensor histidine kinase inhibitor